VNILQLDHAKTIIKTTNNNNSSSSSSSNGNGNTINVNINAVKKNKDIANSIYILFSRRLNSRKFYTFM
jgi:hypothetical protein